VKEPSILNMWGKDATGNLKLRDED